MMFNSVPDGMTMGSGFFGAGGGVTSRSLEAARGASLTFVEPDGAAGAVDTEGVVLLGFAAGFEVAGAGAGAGAGSTAATGGGASLGVVAVVELSDAGGAAGCSSAFGAHALRATTNSTNKVRFQARIAVFSFRFQMMLEQGQCQWLARLLACL